MMLQLLRAGGMPVLTDHVRQADDDNPKGYLEFEDVKQLRSSRPVKWLDDATGKAVKVVIPLVHYLPAGPAYRYIVMHRRVDEILRSQAVMLTRNGRNAALDEEPLAKAYGDLLSSFDRWLSLQPGVPALAVYYHEVVQDPASQVDLLRAFLGDDLNREAMIAAVDQRLYRSRR